MGCLQLLTSVNAAAVGGGGLAFVSAGSIAYAAGTSITPTMPTHQTDDILIVSCQNQSATSTSTATGGWSSIATSSNSIYANWFWKRATGAGTAGPTITSSAGEQHAIGYVIRGAVAAGTPYEDATVNALSAANHTTPFTATIDTTSTNRLAMCFLMRFNDNAWATPPPPSGWTSDSSTTTTDGLDSGFYAISKAIASASTVSSVQIGTWNAGDSHWHSLTLAFIPA
jgi:hypothetical protein